MVHRCAVSLFAKFLIRLTALCAIIFTVGILTPTYAQGSLAKITSSNADKLKLLSTLSGHTGNVLSLAFSPDGNMLASGSVDTTIRLWNVQNPGAAQPGAVLQGHTKQVAIVGFAADGKSLISGGYDYTIRIWDVQSGKQTSVQGSKDKPGPMMESMVNSFNPDISLLLYDANGAVALWDVKKGEPITVEALNTIFKTWGWVALAPDSKSIYLSDVESNQIYQMPVPAGEGKVALTGPDGTLYDGPLAVSPDGNWLAVATSSNESIHLFDLKSGKVQVWPTGDQNDQYLLVFSPDSGMLISAGGDASRIWDVKTGKAISTFPKKQFMAVAFNSADTLLAVATPQMSSTVPAKIELWGVVAP
jgi:WD40 repeat protein